MEEKKLTPEGELMYRIIENWGNAVAMPQMEGWIKEYGDNRVKHGLPIALLPADNAVQNWFEENIDKECSASSAIYKFRLWLESLQREFQAKRQQAIGLGLIEDESPAAGREEDAVNPVKFHKWLIENHWEEHSSGRYWHRSKDRHQWPPEETREESELVTKFKQQKEKP